MGAGVAVQYVVSSDKLKFRTVLDLSRHVNYFISPCSVQLDALPQLAHLLNKATKFCGFDVPDEDGNVDYYQFINDLWI